MSAFNEPSSPEEIPAPSALGSLVSAFVEGWVATHPKEEALAWLRATAQVLADRTDKASVVIRLRKKDRDAAKLQAAADLQAVAMFRQMLEGCVARLLPDEDDD